MALLRLRSREQRKRDKAFKHLPTTQEVFAEINIRQAQRAYTSLVMEKRSESRSDPSWKLRRCIWSLIYAHAVGLKPQWRGRTQTIGIDRVSHKVESGMELLTSLLINIVRTENDKEVRAQRVFEFMRVCMHLIGLDEHALEEDLFNHVFGVDPISDEDRMYIIEAEFRDLPKLGFMIRISSDQRKTLFWPMKR